MKLRYKFVTGFLFFVLMGAVTVPSFAQIEDVSNILRSSTEDANLLVKEYLKPFGAGFGAALNTGWTNTAKTHQKLGFDLTVSAGLAIVPDADLSFNVQQIGLQQLELESGNPETPTINGTEESGPTMAAYADIPGAGNQKLFDFQMPQGTGFRYVPSPMIKAGIGVIKNTDLMIRYMPEYKIQDFGSFKLFGIGVKHDIKQWIPGGSLIPVDLSVMFGYTSMDISADFEILPSDVIDEPNNTANPYSASTWEGQGIKMTTNGWTIDALVGKTLPMISIYGGIGYEASTLNIKTPSSYPTIIPNPDYDTSSPPSQSNPQYAVDKIDEPINLKLDGKNHFRALAGFRFRVAIFHVSASYTFANYSSYNLAVGISFR